MVRSKRAHSAINKSKPFERLRTSQNLTLEMLGWALVRILSTAYAVPKHPQHALHQQEKGTPEGVAMTGGVERECSLHKKIIEASCCITIRQPPQPEALTLSTLQHRMTGWRIVRHRKKQSARLMQPAKFGFSELTAQKKGYGTDVRSMSS
jgi:hypothetical protein